MVDLRPLLFINFLLLMLLITAGFTPISPTQVNVADNIPEATVPLLAEEKQAVTKPQPTQLSEDEAKSKKALASLRASEEAAFAEEAIFTDETYLMSKDQTEKPAFNPDAEQNQFEQLDMKPTLKQAVAITFTPPPIEEPKEKPITTGTLVVRSNVTGDTVLINGKPYGSTKLELQLTPGSYNIEVAKEGYQDWNNNVDIRRGTTKTLNARLEHYTKVEYVNGEWLHNIKTGQGNYLDEGKLEYNGSFVNGKFHGSGSVRYANGMKYQGEWFEGKMEGEGSLTTTDGDTYNGEMDDSKFNGDGTLTKATGDIYNGFWIDGVLNGQGSLTTKGGLLYVGGFADNLFHGSGSLTYPDGGHYEGSFSNGMYHGKGAETYAIGKKYVGQFIDGLYHGKGEILNPNGSKITGTFKDGEPFGKATLTTAEGEVFTARSSEPGVCYRSKSYRATECPHLDGW